MATDESDTITTQVASLVDELRADLGVAVADGSIDLDAMTPDELATLDRVMGALAELANSTITLQDIASTGTAPTAALAHQHVCRIVRKLRPLYGRRVHTILAGVKGAPAVGTDELVAVLVRGRAGVRAALDGTDDPAVRAALLAALRALDELHAIETHAPIRQVITDVSVCHGSRCEHSPPTLTRCTHHRRHLVKLSTNDADPAPMHRPGAMTRRLSPCIGGC